MRLERRSRGSKVVGIVDHISAMSFLDQSARDHYERGSGQMLRLEKGGAWEGEGRVRGTYGISVMLIPYITTSAPTNIPLYHELHTPLYPAASTLRRRWCTHIGKKNYSNHSARSTEIE